MARSLADPGSPRRTPTADGSDVGRRSGSCRSSSVSGHEGVAMGTNDLLRQRQGLARDVLGGRLTRRQALQRGAALGLSASALSGLLRDGRLAAAQTPSGSLVSWAPAGQRWELPQKAVYPLFQKKFPDIKV